MRSAVFGLFMACWVVAANAVADSDLRQALGELAASSQDSITVQDLLEGPPELTTSLPLFNQLVREDQRELLCQIGELHLFGDGPAPHNASHAELFLGVSAGLGSAQAQFLLGVQQASTADEASALLYLEFAAHGSSIGASMALGYCSLHGFGMPKSCSIAMRHYKYAADRVVTAQSDQKFQLFAFPEPIRLAKTEGARYQFDVDPAEDFQRAEYLRQRAADFRSADLMVQSASITLFSDLYKTSDRSDVEEHLVRERQAVQFLEKAIDLGSIQAQALLGHVHAYGLAGCLPNVTKAMELYEVALNASRSGEAANGLGVIYSRGLGDIPVDLEKARKLFMIAANAGHAEGVYNTGMAFLELGAYHTARAKEYFVAAAHVGHLKSLFQLARIKQRQLHSSSSTISCEEVVELYKRVAEYSQQGKKVITKALTHAQRGNWAVALELYLIAAEMGYEVAQSNTIWLIERIQRQMFGTSSSRDLKQLNWLHLRLITRAAGQDSIDALLRMGDSAFHEKNYVLALRHYQHADLVSAGTCAQALYNVGYMYEHGYGMAFASLERASLYYHLAGEKEPTLRLVMVALKLKLHVQTSFQKVWKIATPVWTVLNHDAAVDDVSSPSRSMEDRSIPTSRDVSELDRAYQQQMMTAVADTDGNEDSILAHEFAAALHFLGERSQLLMEFARDELPLEQQDFTIETWLCITDLPSDEVVTLVDALDNFQLELIRATGDTSDSWILRFRKFSLVDEQLPELVLRFANAPLTPHTWNHVAITFDATFQTVILILNGRVKQVLSFRPHPASPRRSEEATIDGATSSSSKFFAVGSTIGRIYGMSPPNSRVFSGQLVHFRFWKSRKTAKEISVLMLEQYNEVVTRDLLVHLRYKIHGSSTDSSADTESEVKSTPNRVLNGDQTVPNTQGVQFQIVEFPPSK
ncbi:Protein sel-1 2 [Phytophthora citrophthora]|uniref:Protein sel-1 2 n=1 Tax=Phytophthora citrophthora TaxID=4793 RepID=A0AAD9LRM7_9STRA|nr:Protein sel-1 2 [Phytophthora citrophthora]